MAGRAKPKRRKETGESVRTFQTRLGGDWPGLADMAVRYNRAKRTLYGRASLAGNAFASYKEKLCAEFGLPARMFNAIQRDLSGMVKSAQEKAKFDLGEVAERVERTAKALDAIAVKLAKPEFAGAKRKKARTEQVRKQEGVKRLAAKQVRLAARSQDPMPSLCFGGRRRFNAQHHLHENGHGDHAAWLKDWRDARSDQFMVVGSSDEPDGNKTCRAAVDEDGSVSLRLFMGPGHGYLDIPGLTLPYGHGEWLNAVADAQAEFQTSHAWQKQTSELFARKAAEFPDSMDDAAREAAHKEFTKERAMLRRKQEKAGHGLSYRFQRDSWGWRVFVAVTRTVPLLVPDFSRGCIGLDLNDQFVSRTRAAADGAFADNRDMRLVTNGGSAGQNLAAVHDLAHELVSEAARLRVPPAIETLDFTMKKRRLREVGCAAAARRLSSFAYSRFAAVLKSHARLHGVCVVEVNPAYTSVIGAALHVVPNGLTLHGGAAMSIARRAIGVEETLPRELRVWNSGRRPLVAEGPPCLRGKAAVQLPWPGWAELSKAVRQARDAARQEPTTGTMRRREARLRASPSRRPSSGPGGSQVRPPGGTPGEARSAATAGGHRKAGHRDQVRSRS